MTICSLQHNVNSALALRRLDSSGGFNAVRRWLNPPLRGIAEIYIPYRLYRVTAEDRGVRRARYYAIDAASGALDPYEFANPPEPHEFEVETRNCYPVRLAENETRSLAIQKLRRLLFSGGFFRLAHPQLTAELIHSEFYLPYWVGFYGDEQNVNLKVLNAVRETMEGNKVRHLLQTWLLENPAGASASDVSAKSSILEPFRN
jgi:hypothetical protein